MVSCGELLQAFTKYLDRPHLFRGRTVLPGQLIHASVIELMNTKQIEATVSKSESTELQPQYTPAVAPAVTDVTNPTPSRVDASTQTDELPKDLRKSWLRNIFPKGRAKSKPPYVPKASFQLKTWENCSQNQRDVVVEDLYSSARSALHYLHSAVNNNQALARDKLETLIALTSSRK